MQDTTPAPPFTVNENLTAIEALNHASDMLRCNRVSLYECADNLKDPERSQIFAAVQQLQLIDALVGKALEELPGS